MEFKHGAAIDELTEYHMMLKTFPFSKVIQWKYVTSPHHRLFLSKSMQNYITHGDYVTLDDFKQGVRKVFEELRDTRPELPRIGWYDAKVYREAPGNEEELARWEAKKEKSRRNRVERQIKAEEAEAKAKELAAREAVLVKEIKDYFKDLGVEEWTYLEIKGIMAERFSRKVTLGCFNRFGTMRGVFKKVGSMWRLV